MMPHCPDRERFARELRAALDKRVCEVAASAGCAVQNVLCNLFVDCLGLGALSATGRTELEQLMAQVCGSFGLATVLASEVPANHACSWWRRRCFGERRGRCAGGSNLGGSASCPGLL